jgi:hypothetical protein
MRERLDTRTNTRDKNTKQKIKNKKRTPRLLIGVFKQPVFIAEYRVNFF